MKTKSPSIKFYAISGYYSTVDNSLGIKGHITSYVKAAYSVVVNNYTWFITISLLLLVLIIIYRYIRAKIDQHQKEKELDRAFTIEDTRQVNF